MTVSDPTARFTERVADYAAHRPSYPPEVIGVARARGCPAARRRRGRRGIRHRDPDRAAARPRQHRARRRAQRGDGGGSDGAAGRRTRASTPSPAAPRPPASPDASCDVVTAAQAFHWFDVDPTRREFQRILRPGGAVVLVWNIRRTDATPFLREYEELLQRFALDYKKISAGWADEQAIARFFAPSPFEVRGPRVPAGLRVRRAARAAAVQLVRAARRPPAARADDRGAAADLRPPSARRRRSRFEYDTQVYWGRLLTVRSA